MAMLIKILSSVFLLLLLGCSGMGGGTKHQPEHLNQNLSAGAKQLIEKAFEGVDANNLVDYQVHLAGLNTELNGTFVNAGWQNIFLDPLGYLRFRKFKNAAAIKDTDDADAQYLGRLHKLIQNQPGKGKYGLMAFDYFHTEAGSVDKELSSFYVPNDYVVKIAKQHPDKFFPILSIHPYRDDAVDKLKLYAKQGAKFVKWRPSAMGINPSPLSNTWKLHQFYKTMMDYDMVLISHIGDDKFSFDEESQHLGNPAYLTMPLDMGLKVLMSPFTATGICKENEVEIGMCEQDQKYFDLAFDMMKQREYEEILFADISSLMQHENQQYIKKIILSKNMHDRLVNGSNYPMPAMKEEIQTKKISDNGYLNKEESTYLNEIYQYNPMLFDFVLKRTVKTYDPSSDKMAGIPTSIFVENEALPLQ